MTSTTESARALLRDRPPRPLAAGVSAHDVALVRMGRAGLFRRSHSKPEHPTSNMAASAVASENRGQLRQSCQQLVLLRNFSVREQDMVICNRVRCGLDPAAFQGRDGADPAFQRSLSIEEARVATLLRRRRSVTSMAVNEAGEAPVAPVGPVSPSPEQRSPAPVKMEVDSGKAPGSSGLKDAVGSMPPLSLAHESEVAHDSNNSNSSSSSAYSSATSDSSRVAPLESATSDEEDDDVSALRDTLGRQLPPVSLPKKGPLRMRAASESALLLKARIKKSKGNPFNRYKIRDPFANGAYGKVCAGQDNSSQQEVAVKIVPKSILVSPEEKLSVVREQSIHQTLSHPHIIKLIDVFEDEGAHYFVLERADAGALTSVMSCAGMDEDRCRDVFRQLLLALEYLHLNHIVHHDIKPHNVLLHQNGIKLCDFGASRAFEPNETTLQFAGIFGTPGYIGTLPLSVVCRANRFTDSPACACLSCQPRSCSTPTTSTRRPSTCSAPASCSSRWCSATRRSTRRAPARTRTSSSRTAARRRRRCRTCCPA